MELSSALGVGGDKALQVGGWRRGFAVFWGWGWEAFSTRWGIGGRFGLGFLVLGGATSKTTLQATTEVLVTHGRGKENELLGLKGAD